MQTLGDIISLRQNKYNEDLKRPFSQFWNGYHNGWFHAYQDLKEILEQHGFNSEIPVIKDGETNADRIRAMSDEELASLLSSLAFDGETPWSVPFMAQICMSCPTVKATLIEGGEEMELHECDFADGKCPHGDEVIWWLKQPANSEGKE